MDLVKGKTILIVEDEEGIRMLLEDILSSFNARVLKACDGQEGIDMFKDNEIDVVLSDVQMPRMTGIEMCEEIYRLDASVPVVLITAFGDAESMLSALRSRVFEFVSKPFQEEFVIKTVQNALEQRLIRQSEERLLLSLQSCLGLGDDVSYRELNFEDRIKYLDELVTIVTIQLKAHKDNS
ncbi:response regulator [Bacteriovoracaceae bacterium]|nr:response regulator [Bacteriovoracaceae bacterium]